MVSRIFSDHVARYVSEENVLDYLWEFSTKVYIRQLISGVREANFEFNQDLFWSMSVGDPCVIHFSGLLPVSCEILNRRTFIYWWAVELWIKDITYLKTVIYVNSVRLNYLDLYCTHTVGSGLDYTLTVITPEAVELWGISHQN